MSIAGEVLTRLCKLPPQKQRMVLEYVESLREEPAPSPEEPRPSLRGLWEGLDCNVTDEDIAEARREMWGNFPREFPR